MKRQSIKTPVHHSVFNDLNKKEVATLKKDIHKGWVYFWTRRGYPHNIKFTTDIQIKK